MNNDGMTSRERVLACIRGEDIDRLPVICPTSVATFDSCQKLGIKFNEAHLNADKMAAVASSSVDLLSFDSVMPNFGVVTEAAAFGCEINWGSETELPSQRTFAFTEPDDFKMPEDFLEKPSVKTVLEAIKLLKKKYGDNVAIIGKAMGPWTLSYNLYGLENVLVDTMLEPEKLKSFLSKFKDISVKFAEAQFEAGADIVLWGDHATADLVSVDTYKEFVMGHHEDINRHFGSGDTPLILHCCGNTQDRISLFAESGFPIFHFDSRNDVAESVKSAGKMLLTGCVNNANVLLNGSVEDVKKQVNHIIDNGVRLISAECAIPLKVKNENLTAIVDVVKERAM